MKDKIKNILLCILYLGVPIGLAIACLAVKIYWLDTPISECPMWVLWLLR